jgi:uncharacterized membrane protein SirB2
MQNFELIKTLHVLTVVISGALFILRVALRMVGDSLPGGWLRIVPHINDSALLFFALSMLYVAQLNPFTQPWLIAKILALLLYIGLGAWSLRAATSKQCGLRAIPAGGVFAYIVGAALTKSVLPVAWFA